MRNILLAVVACTFLFASSAVAAKYGEVDFGVIAKDSEPALAIAKAMKQTFGVEDKKLRDDKVAFDAKVKEFRVQSQALSEDARKTKTEELRKEESALLQRQRKFVERARAAEQSALRDMSALMLEATREYGRKNGYEMIIAKAQGAVLYLKNPVDVTKQVMVVVNRIYRTKLDKFKAEQKKAKKAKK
ncbi:OmpH family outer membrane protein [Halodesulfovibrio aestuarii]|uniref:Periplasmic chaperone for outer membrane proteins Skp n=1 Tax=Halodesulfovibrio aestuarii TaxID=126333 RepID=A0A8G2CB88_9BACT|nr:OmpH family outer membrane protein [Halodesulfovibrio aestuarii]SHJ49453.1 periplasmic chaperone for outer membrane proteins Skp [Halodesulfovibrio aestuarii]